MRIRLSAQALGQRIASLEASLQGDGEVTRPVPDREPPDGFWFVDIRVAAPGYGLPQVAAYRYQEWWQSDRGAWELTAYAYDYRFGPSLSGVFGHHSQDAGDRPVRRPRLPREVRRSCSAGS
jgi:hypothetical protein